MVIADKADNILDSYLLLRKLSFACVVGSGGDKVGSGRGADISGESKTTPSTQYDKPAPMEMTTMLESLPSRGGDARPDVEGLVNPRSSQNKMPSDAVQQDQTSEDIAVQQVQPAEDVAVQQVQPAEAGDRREEVVSQFV